MKNLKRKGFTIIELVIVIAVIAVLAAVLIPTFSNLIKKANESVDIQFVRQLNTTLKTDEIVNGKPQNIEAVKTVLAKEGYQNPVPVKSDSFFAWDPEENVIILIDKKTGLAVFPDEYKGENYTSTWPILSGTANKNMEELGSDLQEAINNAEIGQTIVLSSDQTLNATSLPKNVSLNLGGHTLTLTNGLPFEQNTNVEISNGKIITGQITMTTGASLILNDVDVECNDSYAIFPYGDSPKLIIKGGSITGAVCGIGTSYSSGENTGVQVNIDGVTFGSEDDPCEVGIMMITSGDIVVTNCNIYSDGIAIAQRCGNVTVKNTTIHYLRTEDYKDTFLGSDGAAASTPNGEKSQSWLGGIGDTTGNSEYKGPGIRAPFVVGDFRAKHYSHDANCIIENVTINSVNDTYPNVYLSQENYDVLQNSDGKLVKGTEEIVKTTLVCDSNITWQVNPGKNDSFVEACIDGKEIFANYAGFYYSSSVFGGTALHYVDNVYVNGVEQAPGSTSENNIVAGDLAVNLPSFVGTFDAGEYDSSVLKVNYPSTGETYDYTAEVIEALKADCGLELTREQLIAATLEFGSTPNRLKFVKYVKDGNLCTQKVTGIDGRLVIGAIEHLGFTGNHQGSDLVKTTVSYFDVFKTICEARGITLTDSSKIVIGEGNYIIAVK